MIQLENFTEAEIVGRVIDGEKALYEIDGTVDFVQIVRLKSGVKTNLRGTVEFMACNDQQCLPPATVSFNIPIQ